MPAQLWIRMGLYPGIKVGSMLGADASGTPVLLALSSLCINSDE